MVSAAAGASGDRVLASHTIKYETLPNPERHLTDRKKTQMNFISTGNIYEDFHLQTSEIPINRRRRRFAKCFIS